MGGFYSLVLRNESSEFSVNKEGERFLDDLQINNIITLILGDMADESVRKIFYSPLRDIDNIKYRHDLFRSLSNSEIRNALTRLSYDVLSLLKTRNDKGYSYPYIRTAEILKSLSNVIDDISMCVDVLKKEKYSSEALEGFYEYLQWLKKEEEFRALVDRTAHIKSILSRIRFCMLIQESTIRIFKCEESGGLKEFIAEAFDKDSPREIHGKPKFRNNELGDYMRNVILELVSGLYPDEFRDLRDFINDSTSFPTIEITRFAVEFQFYLSYLILMDSVRSRGLHFCFPVVNPEVTSFSMEGFYSLWLERKSPAPITPNDLHLEAQDHIAFIIGPNSSGKTTLATAIGQIAYLASLGVPVPAKQASLPLFTKIRTIFPVAEDVEEMIGRLEEELSRMNEILTEADEKTLIVLNEFMGSTNENDALNLYKEIIPIIKSKGSYCISVTFLNSLEELPDIKVYSALIPADDPTARTHVFTAGPLSVKNYALELARHYRIIYEDNGRGDD